MLSVVAAQSAFSSQWYASPHLLNAQDLSRKRIAETSATTMKIRDPRLRLSSAYTRYCNNPRRSHNHQRHRYQKPESATNSRGVHRFPTEVRTAIAPPSSWVVNSDLTVMAVLMFSAMVGQVMEDRTKIGATLSAPIVALGSTMLLASIGILPAISAAYELVWSHLMPLAVALALLGSNLRQLLEKQFRVVLKAFVIGAVGSIIGTLVAYYFVGGLLGVEGWRIAACLCASYIGGSLNFASTAQAIGMGGSGGVDAAAAAATLGQGSEQALLAAGMAADNVAMALYLTVLMIIPATRPGAAESNPDILPKNYHCDKGNCDAADSNQGEMSTKMSIISSLATSLIVLDISRRVASAFGQPSLSLGLASIIAPLLVLITSTASSKYIQSKNSRERSAASNIFSGSSALSAALMLVFFATLGACADIKVAISMGGPVFLFILILLLIQLGFSLALGKGLLGYPTWAILVAANANVGGPATASAMAAAKGWKSAVQPAILTGTLGYSIGTILGCLMAKVLSVFPMIQWPII